MRETNKTLISFIMITLGIYLIKNALPGENTAALVLYFLLFVLIVTLSNYFNILMHELGHFVCGSIARYEFSSINIGIFRFEKKEGKIHFRLVPVSRMRGQCVMLYNENVTKKGHILYYIGGILFNALTAIIFTAVLLIFFNRLPFAPFSHIAILYNIFLSLLSLWRNASKRTYGIYATDGQMIMEFQHDTLYAREYYKVENVANKLKLGEELQTIQLEDIVDEDNFFGPIAPRVLMLNMQLAYYNFAKAALNEEKAKAQRMIEFITKHIEILPPANQLIHYYETVFYYIHFDYNFEKASDAYNKVEKVIKMDSLACSYRVRAYFEYYMMYNKPEALYLIGKARESLKEYPVPGLAKYEAHLLERLEGELHANQLQEVLRRQDGAHDASPKIESL